MVPFLSVLASFDPFANNASDDTHDNNHDYHFERIHTLVPQTVELTLQAVFLGCHVLLQTLQASVQLAKPVSYTA